MSLYVSRKVTFISDKPIPISERFPFQDTELNEEIFGTSRGMVCTELERHDVEIIAETAQFLHHVSLRKQEGDLY